MDNLALLFQILVSTVIAVSAVFSVLLVGINALLNAKIGPLRENQARFDSELKDIKTDLSEIKHAFSQMHQTVSQLHQTVSKLHQTVSQIQKTVSQLQRQ